MKGVEDQFGDWASILSKICEGKNIIPGFDLGFLFVLEIDYHLHQGFASPYFIRIDYCYATASSLLVGMGFMKLFRHCRELVAIALLK